MVRLADQGRTGNTIQRLAIRNWILYGTPEVATARHLNALICRGACVTHWEGVDYGRHGSRPPTTLTSTRNGP
jgi:hypothetical protein